MKTIVKKFINNGMFVVKLGDSPIYHVWVKEELQTGKVKYEITEAETNKKVPEEKEEYTRVKAAVINQ